MAFGNSRIAASTGSAFVFAPNSITAVSSLRKPDTVG